MRTDTIFYQLFQSYPNLIFELMGLPSENAEGYKFISVEIKEKSFRFDGILFPDSAEKAIWFVEVQFQKVEEFYRQFITEIMLYLNQYAPVQDWRAVAIYPDRQTESAKPVHYRELFESGRLTAVYMNELAEDTSFISLARLIITPEDSVIESAKALVSRYPEVNGLLEFVETILAYKLKNLSREEISAMFTMGDLKQTRVYQDAYQEALQKGRLEGRLEGRQEGKQEGEVRTILRLLNRRFGNLSPQLTHQITALSLDNLDNLADAILDMQKLEDLIKWLSTH